MTISKKSILGAGLLLLATFGAAWAVEPMPYDSIGNPLNNLPATDATVQRQGDLLNLLPNRVRVNQAGYRQIDVAKGLAKFYYVGTGVTFSVINNAGTTVGNGVLTPKGGVTVSGKINPYASNSAEHQTGGNGDWKTGYPMTGTTVSGTLMQGVLPVLPTGQYRILVGLSDYSVPFVVSDNVYAMARDAALKFFGVARSGDYESWFHPPSHMWDGWLYDSAAKNLDGTYKYKGALKGGWYDCGNHLKEARTISYPLATLGMLAATMKEKDADRYALNQGVTHHTDGIPDVLREAWVGAQFVFNSYRLAKGKTADMILSVGDPGPDFGWWGRPENQDAVLSLRRGGRKERVLLKNWGSGSMGDFAAGMAFLGRLYRPYDRAFADSALTIAKAMYETGKSSGLKETAPDYSGDGIFVDDLALAAVALLWATQDGKYLKDLAYTPGMPDGTGGVCGPTQVGAFPLNQFEGGFMGCGPNGLLRQMMGPTDYGTVNALALYSFAKLILPNTDTAKVYGISVGQRDTLLIRTINQMIGTHLSGGPPFIQTPAGNQYSPAKISYDSIWYKMDIGSGKSGWWNKYQFGNLADLYLYYDVTSLVDGKTIVNMPGSTDWKRKEVLQVLLGGLNYMFGTNALDLSYLYGIGRKNPMHPHHRGANPEGKNVPGAYYNYTTPVGGLYAGIMGGPSNTEVLKDYFDVPVEQTEANCPDAQAVVMIPLMGLASDVRPAAPNPVVKVLYTLDTSAVIQIDLDKWGFVELGYGLDSTAASQLKIVKGKDTGNSIRITINGLKPATQYYFHVVSSDLVGLSSTVSKWPNGQSDSIAFNFTTKAVPPPPPQFGSIKVCNVTSDSAEIMWYTPGGEYLSSVLWADSASWKMAKFSVVDSDMVGNVPVKFHHVKLYGLKPKTTYDFRVGVPGVYDPVVSCFRTPNEDVKFEIKTTTYTWGGQPAMGIAVVNQDVKDYDSLQIRLYVNGTTANILDLAARVDIAFKYRSDGFIDSGLFVYTRNVSKSRPKKIDPTCPDASVCAWYFDLPMYGATMESQARWRLDVVFDKHLLERDSTDILNMPPTHNPFAVGGADWSMRPHVAGADNGLSPLDYGGVPVADKEDIDRKTMDIPVNPYIAVYRRNEFVYGFSPFAAEQATKRTVFAMNVAFQKPFDVANGSTIQIGTGGATRLKGTLDPYDVMMPGVKGYITAIWMNGVALSDAERKAALTRRADGTWNVDLPVRLVTGTNKIDVTFFAGSDSTEKVATGGCDEGKGCAFYNANWYVNYVSNLTQSVLSVVDGLEKPVGLVTPDSSLLRIRLKDGNANASKTVVDNLNIRVTNMRTGALVVLSLPETGANTGVFQTDLLNAVSSVAALKQIQTIPGDTLVIKYVDAADSSDSSSVRIWSRTSWPSLVSGAVVAGCGSNRIVANLDRSLGDASSIGPEMLVNFGFESPVDGPAYYVYTGTLAGWYVNNVDLVGHLLGPDYGAPEGTQSLDLNGAGPGSIHQVIASPVGARLHLSLRYSFNPLLLTTAPLSVAKAQVSVNGVTLGTVIWDVGAEPVRTWKNATFDVIATGRDSIDISSLINGNAGIMVDDISIKLLSGGATGGDSILSGRVVLTGLSGDTLSIQNLSSSDVAVGITGADLSIASTAKTLRGVTGGVLTLQILTKSGKVISTSTALADSIGPWIDSAKIVENLTGNPVDTVFLWTSEAVKALGKSLPVLVVRGVNAISTAGLVVDSAWISDAATGRWTYTVRGGVIKARDSLRFRPLQVFDLSGSPALDCPSLLREVKLVSRPAPFSRAWLKDVDGDGRADQVTMVFRKQLVATDLPDSIQLGFGTRSQVRTVAVAMSQVLDSVVSIRLPNPFPLGDTRGMALDGSGVLGMWKSAQSNGPYSLIDSVGPVLLTAKLRFGSGATDSLELGFSEPIRRTGGSGWLVMQPGFELGTAGVPDSLTSVRWMLPIDTSVVAPGDSVRPLATGKWVDVAAANKVGVAHPWVVVTGGERAPLGGWFMDSNGDGAVDLATVTFGKAPRTRPAMRLLWPSLTGFDTTVVDSGAWILNADGLTATIKVGPFTKNVTSTPNNQLGRWTSAGVVSAFRMEDRVAAVIVSAGLRYAALQGAPDTLRVRWSEAVTWYSGPLVSHKNLLEGVVPEVVLVQNVVVDPDGLGAMLLLDSTSTKLFKGDSARLAPLVADRLGNIANDPTVWVPVVFGRRPVRLDSKLHAIIDYQGWQLGTKAPFVTWIRQGGEKQWMLPDGTEPLDTLETHFAGLTLSLNQLLEGAAYVFDNAGVFVASVNFAEIHKMVAEGRFQPDPSGMFQIRLAWDGRSKSGKLASSGVYYMRLVLKFEAEDGEKTKFGNRVYTLGLKRKRK